VIINNATITDRAQTWQPVVSYISNEPNERGLQFLTLTRGLHDPVTDRNINSIDTMRPQLLDYRLPIATIQVVFEDGTEEILHPNGSIYAFTAPAINQMNRLIGDRNPAQILFILIIVIISLWFLNPIFQLLWFYRKSCKLLLQQVKAGSYE